jgi:protein O-mannosyl-transferase
MLVLTGLVWIAFGNSLNHDFAWDDYDLIMNNKKITQLSSVSDFFTESFWNIDKKTQRVQDRTRNFFRPLVMASYVLDYRLYGLNPGGFHLTNILAHTLCVLLVYMLAARLLKNLTVALIVTAIWAIHPTHVENVAWISGRTDILAGFFFFLSCLFFLEWFNRPKNPWLFMTGTAVCYALALLCKEMAITLPGIFLMAFFLPENRKYGFRQIKGMLGALALVTFGYLEIRYLVLGGTAAATPGISTGHLLLTLPMVFTRYVGLVLGLVPTDPHHAAALCRIAGSLGFGANCIAVLAYGAVTVLAWLRGRYRLFFCLLWFPVTLTPVFKLGGFGDILYADRFLYIPSVGLLFAAVSFIHLFVRRNGRLVGYMATGLCCIYLFMNISYTRACGAYWKDNLSLFSRAIKTSPDSPYIQFGLGKTLSDVEAYEDALDAYDKAIALYPTYVEAHNNKALVLNRLGRYGEALFCSNQVMSLMGAHYTTLVNMGDSFLGFGDSDVAEDFYTGSLAIQETAIGHHRLALCLMEQGKYERAEKHFMAALSIKRNPRILNSLGTLLLRQKEPNKTIRYARAALRHLKPGIPSNIKLEIYYNMARAFLQKEALDQAADYMKKACDLLASGYGLPPVRKKITEWFDVQGFSCGKD